MGENKPKLSPRDILGFAWQIAKGMNYLADMKVRIARAESVKMTFI